MNLPFVGGSYSAGGMGIDLSRFGPAPAGTPRPLPGVDAPVLSGFNVDYPALGPRQPIPWSYSPVDIPINMDNIKPINVNPIDFSHIGPVPTNGIDLSRFAPRQGGMHDYSFFEPKVGERHPYDFFEPRVGGRHAYDFFNPKPMSGFDISKLIPRLF